VEQDDKITLVTREDVQNLWIAMPGRKPLVAMEKGYVGCIEAVGDGPDPLFTVRHMKAGGNDLFMPTKKVVRVRGSKLALVGAV
jgi:hypothetical protein